MKNIHQTQFITDGKGHKTAVVLSLTNYDELMEDIHDLSVIADRKDESVISFESVKCKLTK